MLKSSNLTEVKKKKNKEGNIIIKNKIQYSPTGRFAKKKKISYRKYKQFNETSDKNSVTS